MLYCVCVCPNMRSPTRFFPSICETTAMFSRTAIAPPSIFHSSILAVPVAYGPSELSSASCRDLGADLGEDRESRNSLHMNSWGTSLKYSPGKVLGVNARRSSCVKLFETQPSGPSAHTRPAQTVPDPTDPRACFAQYRARPRYAVQQFGDEFRSARAWCACDNHSHRKTTIPLMILV